MELSFDIEAYSPEPLSKCGVYRYAEHWAAKLLLLSYSFDGGEIRLVDIAQGENVPEEFLRALVDNMVIKRAFNSSFERVFMSEWLKKNRPDLLRKGYLDPGSWHCDMILCAYNGLPMSLEAAGEVIGLDRKKLSEGKDLVRYFCTGNGHSPDDAPDKWERFKAYNRRDVEAELEIQKRLKSFPVPEAVWAEYSLDQTINDRGIRLDMDLARGAIKIDAACKADLMDRMKALTGLANPGSVAQLKGWLSERGIETDSLDKKAVAELLKDAPEEVAEVLRLRQQTARSSTKKYESMENAVCSDGRARGTFQFYGSHTGRFAGRLIQLQNLRKNDLPDLELARETIKTGDYEVMKLFYPDVSDTLSQCIRTALVPKDGYKFVVADFAAIEARALSHLAGERWRCEVFESGGDIYCESASRMFKCKVEKHGENAHLRQKGKIAELACIAEGSLVLTNRGLIPIEDVDLSDTLWDGEEWVEHDGVVFRGYRPVVTYQGLSATLDHLVYSEGWKPFSEIIKGGARNGRIAPVYDIINAGKHHRFTVSGHLVHNCGYGGGLGAMKAMGGNEMGLSDEELQGIVNGWRKANPKIVNYWYDVDRAVKKTITYHEKTNVGDVGFYYRSGMLRIKLPSGRELSYVKPRLTINRFGGESVAYEGLTQARKWGMIETFSGRIVENIVQAVCRDILMYSMQTLKEYRICAHIHDEVIVECTPEISVDEVCSLMSRTPEWIPGLKLDADGYETKFYKKE